MKLKTTVEVEIEIDYDYTPERPAPACQDHDSPRFSDSGDPEELEITEMHILDDDKKIKIPVDICDIICKANIEKLTDEARDLHEDDFFYEIAEKNRRDEVDDYL